MTVFEYTDYRCFLKDYFEQQRSKRSYWSFGKWAQELKVQSPSTLIMLVRGQRNPGRALTEKLIRYFRFKDKEANYFRDLVQLHKTKGNIELNVLVMERLAANHGGNRFQVLDLDTFSAISDWYHYAIRQLTLIKEFKEEPEWIAAQLHYKVTPKQVRVAIEKMLKLGLLKRDSSGKLKKSEANFETSNDVASEALKRFHEQMLDNTKEAIRKFPPTKRENSGVTFAMRSADVPKAKKLIQKFQDDLCLLFEKENPDSVFHLEVGLIPLFLSEEKENNA